MQVDECCVEVWVRDDLFSSKWVLEIGEFIFTSENTSANGFEVCFDQVGDYYATLSANNQTFIVPISIAFCGSSLSAGFYFVNIDKCCVDLLIKNYEPKREWILDMGNGTIINSDINGSDKVSYCYTSSGQYKLRLKYINPNGSMPGAEENLIIDTQECIKRCDYYLCLEEYYGQFGCSNGITVKVNGVIQDIPFTKSISNASWGSNDLIAEFTAIASNLGITYVNYAPQIKTCNKGPSITYGHFFLDSEVEFLTLYGDGSCPNPQNPNAGNAEKNWDNNCGN